MVEIRRKATRAPPFVGVEHRGMVAGVGDTVTIRGVCGTGWSFYAKSIVCHVYIM